MIPQAALLHGFTGAPDAFRRVAALLPQPMALALPTLGGHGPSPDTSASTFEEEVDRLAAALRARGGTFHLAGYSLGGRVAIGLLARHPALFRSATLVGARPGLEDEGERALRVRADARLVELLRTRGLEAFLAEWEALPLFATQAELPPDVLAEQRALRQLHTADGLAFSLTVTGLGRMPPYWEALRRIQVPTFLVVGERDARFTSIARRMAELVPRAHLTVVPGVGHNVVLERPEAVAGVLARAAEAVA